MFTCQVKVSLTGRLLTEESVYLAGTSVGPKCSKCERCYHTVIAKHISHCERFASYCARVPFIL